MATTIKDVARAARVSVATVSRAMNGVSTVRAETRAHILRTAAELHYRPSAAARSLVMRRTDTLGVLLPELHGDYFSELMRGIERAARASARHLLLSSAPGSADEVRAALHAMQGRIDGLLWMPPQPGDASLPDSLPPGLPLVLMNPPGTGWTSPVLQVDNHGGARAIVEHLVQVGCRRIAFIGGPVGHHEAVGREAGYREALHAWLPEARAQILRGDFSYEAGQRAGRRISRAVPRPDAVFAANDMMAAGCMAALHDAGVTVPDDIAVAGFDDLPLARYVTPALTTVRVPVAELGEQAVRLLLAMLPAADRPATPGRKPADPGGPAHVAARAISTPPLRARIVVRRSTGPPRATPPPGRSPPARNAHPSTSGSDPPPATRTPLAPEARSRPPKTAPGPPRADPTATTTEARSRDPCPHNDTDGCIAARRQQTSSTGDFP